MKHLLQTLRTFYVEIIKAENEAKQDANNPINWEN